MDPRALLALLAGGVTAAAAWLVLSSGARDREQLERALGIDRSEPRRPGRAGVTPADLLAVAGGLVPVGLFEALGGRVADPADKRDRRIARGIGLVLGAFVVLIATADALWGLAILAVPRVARILVERRRLDALREQRRRVDREVTSAIDTFVLALEAGLPFDRAISAYTETTASPLAGELAATVRELDVGYRRREALDRLVARTGSASLAALARTIRLAEDFGTPLAGALRGLAIDLRALRRQRLQEAALRAPITMLLPTAGFILVPIFAIILGPIALRVATGTLF
jgi:Flp pilus assembly protein TadB